MNKTGLIESEVLDSRKKYGDNRLPEPKLKSAFSFFMDTFKDKLNLILLCMLIVFTIMAVLGQGSLSEPAGIAVVLVSIAFIGMNTNLKESKEHQKDLRDQAAMDLTALKEEKERTIYQLEADQQIIQIHQSMDSLATNNESERMLERVREGANKTRERANGSKIAYETSAEANDRRLGKSTREREAQELLEKMKRQRKG